MDLSKYGPRNLWGYIRWSNEKQGDDGNTEARQLKYINDMANELKKPVKKVYIDAGVSALKGKNLKLEWAKLMGVVGEGDIILVEDTDRITRKKFRTFYDVIGRVVEDKKCNIILTAPRHNKFEINEKNYEKNLELMMGNMVSSGEGEKRIERLQEGLDLNKETILSGKWAPYRQKPFWVINDVVNKCFRSDEKKVELVRYIFKLYNEGLSLNKIKDKLNADGVATIKNSSKGWSASHIGYILKNKAVCGYFAGIEENVKVYEEIIQPDVFYTIQKKLKDREWYTGPANHNNNTNNLFTGLVYCKLCGGPAYSCICGTNGKKWYYFKCYKRGCGSIRSDRFEESFRTMIMQANVLNTFIENGTQPDTNRLYSLEIQLENIKKKEQKIADLLKNDESGEPSLTLLNVLKELESEERKLKSEYANEEMEVRAKMPTVMAVKDFVKNNLDKVWNTMESRLQIKEVVRAIVKNIVIDLVEKKYTVYFNEDLVNPIEVEVGKKAYKINGMEFKYDDKTIDKRGNK